MQRSWLGSLWLVSLRLVRLCLVLGCACLTGCLAPPPRLLADTNHGTVRANDEVALARIRVLVNELYPRVLEALPGSKARSCDVWAQDELRYYRFFQKDDGHHGFTVVDSEPTRIHVRARSSFPEWIVAHELVHALLGDEWATLPAVVEEGVCDVIAMRLLPEQLGEIRMRRWTGALGHLGAATLHFQYEAPLQIHGQGVGISVTHSISFEIDYEESEWGVVELLEQEELPMEKHAGASYGLGFVLASRAVERVGLSGVLELCRRASEEGLSLVPAEWILEAADLPPSGARWPRDEIIAFGHEELRALALHKWDRIVLLLERVLADANSEDPVATIFSRAKPRLTSAAGAEFSFLDTPELLRKITRPDKARE